MHDAQFLILLGVILAFPLILGVLFKVGASPIFFSIMAGELLARYFHEEAERSLKVMAGEKMSHYGEALILILPVILTAIVMRGTMSRSKLVLNVVPLLIAGIVFAVFLLPILPFEIQTGLRETVYGDYFYELNSAIIGIVILSHLVILWLFDRGEGKKDKKHK